MTKYKYIGSIQNVGLMGKGLIKRGDIIEFNDTEAEGLSKDNWQKVEEYKSGKVKDFSTSTTRKKVYYKHKGNKEE